MARHFFVAKWQRGVLFIIVVSIKVAFPAKKLRRKTTTMRMRVDAISSTTTISSLQPVDVVMEAPALGKIFRRLLSHQTCSRLRYHQSSSLRPAPTYHEQRRSYKGRRDGQNPDDKAQSNWQQRTQILPPDKLQEYEKAPLVTAHLLRGRRERPRRVKMLTRDFIEGLHP